jgi:hypothetical protein
MEVKMNNVRVSLGRSFFGSIVAVVALFTIVSVAGSVFAHGGKKHANSFTPLQALQKSTDLYNQLVGSGKLGESWVPTARRVDKQSTWFHFSAAQEIQRPFISFSPLTESIPAPILLENRFHRAVPKVI